MISILPIIPAEKDRLSKRAASLKEQGLAHSLKKASSSSKKKRKKELADTGAEADSQFTKVLTIPKASSGLVSSKTGLKNAATASLTARVLAEEEAKAKRRKLEGNKNLNSLFSSGTKGPIKDGDFMTRGHSTVAETSR